MANYRLLRLIYRLIRQFGQKVLLKNQYPIYNIAFELFKTIQNPLVTINHQHTSMANYRLLWLIYRLIRQVGKKVLLNNQYPIYNNAFYLFRTIQNPLVTVSHQHTIMAKYRLLWLIYRLIRHVGKKCYSIINIQYIIMHFSFLEPSKTR